MKTNLTPNRLTLALVLALSPGLGLAQALPDGGTFRVGNGTITAPNGTTLNIGVDGSNGDNLSVIDWDGFNIGAGSTVNFQNNTGRPLGVINVDTNGAGAQSNLNGNLNAPAVGGNSTTVLVLNPQGVNVGGSAVINTSGAFVAGAGTVDDTHPHAPAGKVAVRLTQRYITIDESAQIDTGDAQGVGDGVAFMGPQVAECFDCADPNYPGNGTGGASLPFISGRYTGQFYPGTSAQNATLGLFSQTFFLHGFSLDDSGATYQFNGPYQFALLMAERWDIDPNTGEEGSLFWAGNVGFKQSLFGNLDLGNATFTTRNGDGGGFFIGTSGVRGGRFIVPDNTPNPEAPSNVIPNGLNMTVTGNLDGTQILSNGSGRGSIGAGDFSTASLRVNGHIINSEIVFGDGAWQPQVMAGGNIQGSTINMAPSSRGKTTGYGTVSAARNISDSTITIRSTSDSQDGMVRVYSGGAVSDTQVSSAGVPVIVRAADGIDGLLAKGAVINVYARLNINGTIEGTAVQVISDTGKVLGSTIKADTLRVSANGVEDSNLAATGDVSIRASTDDLILAGSTQVEGATVEMWATGDLNIGADGSAVEVRGDSITGNTSGTLRVGSNAEVRVRNPGEATGNNTIWVNTGAIGETADVQSSGHNWFGGTVSIVDGALVLNAPEFVEGPQGSTGISLTGGSVQVDGTLYAGDGVAPPPAPTVPFVPVVIRVFQDGDSVRWTGTRLDIKADHQPAAGGLKDEQ